MTYKWVNVFLKDAQPIIARNCEIEDDGGQFIVISEDRAEYRVNVDSVQYIKIGKSEDME